VQAVIFLYRRAIFTVTFLCSSMIASPTVSLNAHVICTLCIMVDGNTVVHRNANGHLQATSFHSNYKLILALNWLYVRHS
jgi:hypothetical protein